MRRSLACGHGAPARTVATGSSARGRAGAAQPAARRASETAEWRPKAVSISAPMACKRARVASVHASAVPKQRGMRARKAVAAARSAAAGEEAEARAAAWNLGMVGRTSVGHASTAARAVWK